MALSSEQFLRQVVASELLTAEDVAAIVAVLPEDRRAGDGEQMARELVRQKKLTRYQAEQIYSGKGKTLVLGNYVVLDKLGQGGMGVVLKAEHKRLKRLVALKVMSASIVKTPDALKRFHREVEAAAKLRHPNVVATDDADEAKGTHFLVMEYVEGADLSALVKKQGTLSVQQAVQCIIQAARGLEFAHEKGVVHRDIKPANLLLDSKGTVKILDMGLARIEGDSGSQGELTSTGAVMGTVDYMAPEQALSTKHADARSDIYSLGISLWYLLVGRCAYDGDTLMSKLLAHRDSPVPSLREANNEVSESIDLVFRKMVAKKPADRYQTMTDVIRDLEACQTGAAPHVAMPSAPEDLNLQSFLSHLGTSASAAPVTATKKVQTVVTGVRVNPVAEATLLNGNIGIDTDPQTSMSLQNELNAKPKKKLSTQKSKVSPPWFRNVWILAGGGAAALLILLSIIVLVRTQNGTLRVEILDPEVKMTVKGTDVTFEVADKEPVSLVAGEKKLIVTRGDLSFETEVFALKRGEETLVKVELIDGDLIVNSDGTVVGRMSVEQPKPMTQITKLTNPANSDRRAAEWLLTLRGGANLFIETPEREVLELNRHPIPAGLFSIYTIELAGPIIDKFGDRLAEEMTDRIGGIRARSVWIGSSTLTSDGFAKLMAMPELSEVFNLNLSVFHPNMDNRVFSQFARLKRLKQITIASGGGGFDVLQSNFTGVGLGSLKACPELDSLEWQFLPISPAALEELTQLPKLANLRFKNSVFTERHAAAVGKLKLRDLQIHSSQVDDNMLRHLAGMEKLEILDITHNPITDQGLAELRPIKTLKTLLLQGTNVTAEGVAAFQTALPNCEVQWDSPDPDRKFVEWLRAVNPTVPMQLIRSDGSPLMVAPDQPLPRESVRADHILLEGTAFDQAGDDFIEEFATRVKGQRIVFLRIKSDALTSAGVERLVRIPELSTVSNLEICGRRIDDSVFEIVSRFPMLKYASFESPLLTGKGVSLLRQLEGLTLEMTGQQNLKETNIDELQQLPNLSYLNLFYFQCTQLQVESISKLKPGVLILLDAGIDDELVKPLARMSSLHGLQLNNSPLTDRGLSELKELKNLTHLDVRGTKVTTAGVKDLQNALPTCEVQWDKPDPDRGFAEWLRTLGSGVMFDVMNADGGMLRVLPEQPLPSGPLRVHSIALNATLLDQPDDAFLKEFTTRSEGQRFTRVMFESELLTSARLAAYLELPAMADLEQFGGNSPALDDSMFDILAKLPKLSSIELAARGTGLTGRGLGRLKSLTSVTIIQCPSLAPEGLVELQTLPNMTYVNLDGCQCTRQHIAALSKLKLTHLLTTGSEIDDTNVKTIAGMSSLMSVGVARCQLTDVGLSELKTLSRLNYINLIDTKVTAAGVADFQKALPECKIVWDGGQ